MYTCMQCGMCVTRVRVTSPQLKCVSRASRAQLKALLERATHELCAVAAAFGEAAPGEEVSAAEAKTGQNQLEEIGNFLAALEKSERDNRREVPRTRAVPAHRGVRLTFPSGCRLLPVAPLWRSLL